MNVLIVMAESFSSSLFVFFSPWMHRVAYRILVPDQGIKPVLAGNAVLTTDLPGIPSSLGTENVLLRPLA